jgi:anti-anti-sigma factor
MVTAHTLERHIDDALDQQPSALIVDLSAVDFLASHGMGVLLGTYGCIAGRLDFGVVAHGAATSRPMTLLGLGEQFPIYATLDAALETLRVDDKG